MGPDTDPDEGWRSEIGERRSEKGRRGHGTTDHGLRFFLRFHPCSSGFICGLISSGLSFNAEGAEVRRDSQRVLLLCVSLRFLCVSALRMGPSVAAFFRMNDALGGSMAGRWRERGFLSRALSGSIRFYPWSNSSGGCGFFSGFLCRAVVQVLRRPR